MPQYLNHLICLIFAMPNRPDWDDDPLSHPDIARMSEREKADLPFVAATSSVNPHDLTATTRPSLRDRLDTAALPQALTLSCHS